MLVEQAHMAAAQLHACLTALERINDLLLASGRRPAIVIPPNIGSAWERLQRQADAA
jgi:hypothetical protein